MYIILNFNLLLYYSLSLSFPHISYCYQFAICLLSLFYIFFFIIYFLNHFLVLLFKSIEFIRKIIKRKYFVKFWILFKFNLMWPDLKFLKLLKWASSKNENVPAKLCLLNFFTKWFTILRKDQSINDWNTILPPPH